MFWSQSGYQRKRTEAQVKERIWGEDRSVQGEARGGLLPSVSQPIDSLIGGRWIGGVAATRCSGSADLILPLGACFLEFL